MEATHGVDHWAPDDCFGCRIKTIQVAPSATPSRNRGREVLAQNQGEKVLANDLDAYKRMRIAGLHPNRTKGAARIEQRAESSAEVERGIVASDMAKGADKDRGGKEWRCRHQEAMDAAAKGELAALTQSMVKVGK